MSLRESLVKNVSLAAYTPIMVVYEWLFATRVLTICISDLYFIDRLALEPVSVRSHLNRDSILCCHRGTQYEIRGYHITYHRIYGRRRVAGPQTQNKNRC